MSRPSSRSRCSVRKDVHLLCCGREPSTGLSDQRYIATGDAKHPGVRSWPGFRVERSVCLERDRSLVCVCSVRESSRGPLFVVEKRAEEEGLRLVVAGWTMTGVVRRFFGACFIGR